MKRKALLLSVVVALPMLIVGCGGGGSAPISISFTTPPPTSLTAGQSASIVATVANDSSNSGVDWSCAPAGSCGAFSPAHTASGAATSYTAPATAGSVMITATSTKQPSANQTASVNITAAPQLSISFTTPPPTSLTVSQSASIVATVTNDPSNAGVDWSCTPAGSCGTFTPAHTASGAATSYTAPAATGTVMITAAATAQPSKTQTATVNITAVPVSISITTPPPASLEVNLTASVAATVTNDPANAGVDWSCTPTGSCGTFSPAHTASGAATVYTAPGASGPVTLTAASTTQPSQNKSASVNITPIATAGDLTGQYVFFVNGSDANGNPYSVAGSITLGGATITGEQDYFDTSGTGTVFAQDDITGGSISVGSDGRGTLSLTPTSAKPETFSISVVNNKHIRIIQFQSSATAIGSLDFQTVPSSQPSGNNAFALFDPFDAYALGGVMTVTGTSITASEVDDDVSGTTKFGFDFTVGCVSPSCTLTAPDAAGRGTITITDSHFTTMQMAYYVVGPEAFRVIEVDNNAYVAGSIFGQGTGAFSAASLAKPFVFGQSGITSSVVPGIGIFAVAGQFTGNGTSALSAGVADFNDGDGSAVLAGTLVGSAYTVSANGYASITNAGPFLLTNFGVYLVDPAINLVDPNSASGGGGALMLDLDSTSIGIGLTVPQTAGATFVGNYAFGQDGGFVTASASAFYDLVGQIVSNGTSTFAGLVDYNVLTVAQTPGATISGTYAADAANPGRSTAQVTINGETPPGNITLYQASSSLLLDVDVDSPATGEGNVALGLAEHQQ